MSLLIFDFLVLVLVAAASFAFYEALWGRGLALSSRLFSESSPVNKAILSERFSAMARRAARRPSKRGGNAAARLHNTLMYAGFRTVEAGLLFHFVRVALMVALAAAGFALGAAARKSAFGGAALGGLFGYILPTVFLSRIARARQRRIASELPDVLALLVVSLEAGIGLGEVIKLVGSETERQGRLLGRELSATAAQLAAGRTLEDSLKDLGERNGIDELKSLVALAIQSEKLGARIGPALRASAELLNSRRRLSAEETANKAAVKMLIPLVFLVLPAMMLIVLGPAIIQILRMFHHTS